MTTGTQSGATFGVCGTHVGASSSSFTLIWHQPLPPAKHPQRRLAKGNKQKLWKRSFKCFIFFLAPTSTTRQTSPTEDLSPLFIKKNCGKYFLSFFFFLFGTNHYHLPNVPNGDWQRGVNKSLPRSVENIFCTAVMVYSRCDI